MTPEKQRRYVYYGCTGRKGSCRNSYIGEEALSDLPVSLVTRIQITEDVAEGIATALRENEGDSERRRRETLQAPNQRRVKVIAKLDRGNDDFVSGKISRGVVDAQVRGKRTCRRSTPRRARLSQARPCGSATAPLARNSATELHLRPRNSRSDPQ